MIRHMKFTPLILTLSLITAAVLPSLAEESKVSFTRTKLKGIGLENGVMRRDPSDIIKVGDLYYVWYSKGKISSGYDATVWYATSSDGVEWTEKGQALAKGAAGTWECASVFTPNILVAEGKYYLFYTGTARPYKKGGAKPAQKIGIVNPDSKIGVAVSDSPDGPWVRNEANPVITNSTVESDFDSHLVDDSCLITRDGKYWLYYKGRQLGKSPRFTQMGLAVAENPEGPYIKSSANPVIPGNHEVVVYPYKSGVAAMIGKVGPVGLVHTIMYAEDGLRFSKLLSTEKGAWAGGFYRPEAFTDSNTGDHPSWGIEIIKGPLPGLGRYDMHIPTPN